MTEKEEQWRTWKRRTRYMAVRQVPAKDMHKFWGALMEEGVWIKWHSTGYSFYCGQYKVTNKSIAEAWCVSESAVRRLAQWLSEQDDIEGWL